EVPAAAETAAPGTSQAREQTDADAEPLIHGPLHVRSVSLIVLTVVAVLATLKLASAFFIPVMLGLIFSYALSPIVDALERVRIEKPRFDIRDHLWSGTIGLASLIGQVTVVTFLTYFLVLSGDTFRRKLVKISGTTFSEKKITVQALDEITDQIQRYLLVQV